MVVIIALGLGAAAINTGNNLLYLVFSVTLAMIVLSGVLSEMDIQRLDVTVLHLPDIAAEESGFALVRVKNRHGWLQGLALGVALEIEGDNAVAAEGFVPVLGPGGSTQVAVRIQGARRGTYRVKAVQHYTTFPFSFFRKGIVHPVQMQAMVLPRPLPMALDTVLGMQRGMEQPRADKGRQGDFTGVREFRQGDDPKAIHYRISARTGKTMVREFTDMGTPEITVGLSPGLKSQALEDAISRAAFLLDKLLDRGWVVRLTDGQRVTGRLKRAEGKQKGLRFLATVDRVPEGNPADFDVDLWVK